MISILTFTKGHNSVKDGVMVCNLCTSSDVCICKLFHENISEGFRLNGCEIMADRHTDGRKDRRIRQLL